MKSLQARNWFVMFESRFITYQDAHERSASLSPTTNILTHQNDREISFLHCLLFHFSFVAYHCKCSLAVSSSLSPFSSGLAAPPHLTSFSEHGVNCCIKHASRAQKLLCSQSLPGAHILAGRIFEQEARQ